MSVRANNKDVAAKSTSHKIIYSAPSVCLTPVPAAPNPVPIPYPITTPANMKATDDCAGRVLIDGQPTFCVGSIVTSCKGNEPGTQKEVVSHQTSSKAFVIDGSPNVKAQGSAVAFTGSSLMGNRS